MKITSPDSPALARLCQQLAERADATDTIGCFPNEQLQLCGQAGVFEWFLAPEWGGQGWSDTDAVRGYLALSEACLTTTFVITQRTGACRRIVGSSNEALKQSLLPRLASGASFATVGISHLTTSGRHLEQPLLTAEPAEGGYLLNGRAPWVTGGEAADHLVLGASVTSGGQPTGDEILLTVPSGAKGMMVADPFQLVGVSASSTGPVLFENTLAPTGHMIAGPTPRIMSSGKGGRPGGHETSTLALGLASAALRFLGNEAANREDLAPAHQALIDEHHRVVEDLLAIAAGQPACGAESLRSRANNLATRCTQAALTAAKGRGYLAGHPVGRWCREALFFAVWSCPQPVANASLCELAGIE